MSNNKQQLFQNDWIVWPGSRSSTMSKCLIKINDFIFYKWCKIDFWINSKWPILGKYVVKINNLIPCHRFFLSLAPYVNYIRKDPGAPCSLTEALEYLQVDVLEDLIEKDSLADNQKLPPKNKPHNFTVVAMEGCHSFIILDWARPLKDDMVSGKKCFSQT